MVFLLYTHAPGAPKRLLPSALSGVVLRWCGAPALWPRLLPDDTRMSKRLLKND